MPSCPCVSRREVCQGARTDNVQLSLRRSQLKVRTRRCDRFLDCLFAAIRGESAETDPGVSFDGGQDGKKPRLPITG
jgi:hypothetical protein